MKFVLLSDMHLTWDRPVARLDDIVQTGLRKFKFVLDFAVQNEAHILQAGDMFDTPRSWRMLDQVIRLLQSSSPVVKSSAFVRGIFAVFGQHDTYLYSEDTRDSTALGILMSTSLVEFSECLFADEVNLYGASYGQSIPDPELRDGVNILVLHKMILKHKVWSGQSDYEYAPEFLRKYKDFDLILCGDAHQKFLFRDKDRWICNTGPMLRLEASDSMFQHHPGFWLYDTKDKSLKWEQIPHELASKVLTRAHLQRAEYVEEIMGKFVESIKSGVDIQGASFRENLEAFLVQNNVSQPVRSILSEVMEE